MRCEQVTPYLPGYAGGELRAETERAVAEHVATCKVCAAAAATQQRVLAGLAVMQAREVEPPAFLAESIGEAIHQHRARRFAPILPIGVDEVGRLIADHRETIASLAGTAVVAAGAAYALWRAVRGRTEAKPLTS